MVDRVVNFRSHASQARLPQEAGEIRNKGTPYGGAWMHLMKGYDCGDGSAYKTLDDYREAWEQYRGDLLPGWLLQRPGTRPAAWWICECPFHVDGNVTNPLHFGKVVPMLSDQPGILQLHGITDQTA